MRLENVDRIGISLDKIYFINEEHVIKPRATHSLWLNDVAQLQDETVTGERRTLILFKKPVTCDFYERRGGEVEVFCGLHPDEMGKL